MANKTIAVIGGGAIGLACAYYLRGSGLEVELYEKAVPGSGASHGNAGWIVPSLSAPLPGPGRIALALRSLLDSGSPLHLSPRALPGLARWLLAFARRCNARDHLAGLEATACLAAPTMRLFDELASHGVEFDMAATGLLFAFLDERAARAELLDLDPMRGHGYLIDTEPLGAAGTRSLEPALSKNVKAGILVEAERHVDPKSLVRGLVRKLTAMGVTIRTNTAVQGFVRERGRVNAVVVNGEAHQADGVLIAAGAWTGRLAAMLGHDLTLRAGKGYSFSLSIARCPARPVYLGEAMVGCTPMNGHLRLAGTMELSGVDEGFDRRRIDAMARASHRYLDDASWDRITDEWVGMRPLTSDGLPVIGRLPRWENAYVASGHSMLGITLAPATGRAVAQLMTGDAPSVLAPFSPARFERAGRRGARA